MFIYVPDSISANKRTINVHLCTRFIKYVNKCTPFMIPFYAGIKNITSKNIAIKRKACQSANAVFI